MEEDIILPAYSIIYLAYVFQLTPFCNTFLTTKQKENHEVPL